MDILSFIRQLLPPHHRKPVTIALLRVLFGPAERLFRDIETLFNKLLGRAQSNGQMKSLEYALNVAAGFPSGDGPIYLLNGSGKFDFQVVVPTGVPADIMSAIVVTLERYRLKSKRYRITTEDGVTWGDNPGEDPNTTALRFKEGYPRVVNGQIQMAVEPPGTYSIKIYKDGVEQIPPGETVFGADTVFEWPGLPHSAQEGLYRVIVYTPGVESADRTVSVNGRVCDLAWDDNSTATTEPALSLTFLTNQAGGGGIYTVRGRVKSAYADIFPLMVERRQGTAEPVLIGVVETKTFSFDTSFGDGSYQLRVTDKAGCKTIWKSFNALAPGACDLSFAVAPTVERVNNQYRVTAQLSSARSNITPYTIIVKRGTTEVASASVSTNPITMLLPVGTASGAVTVQVVDKQGCQATSNLTLPEVATPTANLRVGYRRDGNAKSLEVFAKVPDGGTYLVAITPLSGQSGANLTNARPMVVTADTRYGVAYNRQYQYTPGFAGGVDVTDGRWRISVYKENDIAGATVVEVQLTGQTAEGDLTPTDNPDTTTGYGKWMAMGSSITAHAPLGEWTKNNGMAASAPEKDYVHLLAAKIRQTNPSATYNLVNSGDFERFFRTYNPANDANLTGSLTGADLVLLRFGENVSDNDVSDGVFAQKLTALIAYCRSTAKPGATIVLTTTCWEQTASPAIVRTVAAATGCLLVDLTYMWANRNLFAFDQYADQAIGKHPNDSGMAEIANQVWAKLTGQTSPPTPDSNPTTPTATTPSMVIPAWDGFNFAPITDTERPGDGVVVATGGGIRVENWLFAGGAVGHVSGPGVPNTIDTQDLGRYLGEAWYDKDGPFHPAGVQVHGTWGNIGYNPIDPGDVYNNPSPILGFGLQNGVAYTKTRPMQWHLNNYATPGMVWDRWQKVIAPNVVRIIRRFTHNRTDKTVQPDSQEFELPYVYTKVGNSRYVYYEGQSPWTGGAVTVRDAFDGSGNPAAGHDRRSFKVSEGWFASINPVTGRGIGIVGEECYNLTHTSHPGTGYIAAMSMRVPDNIGVQYLSYDVVVGTVEEIRAYAASRPRYDYRPNYVFNSRSRLGFTYEKAFDQSEANITNGLVVTSRTGQISVRTADRPFAASGVTNLYVTINNNSTRTDFSLIWSRAGQGSNGEPGHSISFQVPNDGQDHQITIPVGNNPNWTGTIVRHGIVYDNIREEQAGAGRVWTIKRWSYLPEGSVVTPTPPTDPTPTPDANPTNSDFIVIGTESTDPAVLDLEAYDFDGTYYSMRNKRNPGGSYLKDTRAPFVPNLNGRYLAGYPYVIQWWQTANVFSDSNPHAQQIFGIRKPITA